MIRSLHDCHVRCPVGALHLLVGLQLGTFCGEIAAACRCKPVNATIVRMLIRYDSLARPQLHTCGRTGMRRSPATCVGGTAAVQLPGIVVEGRRRHVLQQTAHPSDLYQLHFFRV
jgi:hypothetical protein